MDFIQRSQFVERYDHLAVEDKSVKDIKDLERTINQEEEELILKKATLTLLKERQGKNINLKWREEIRKCITFSDDFLYLKSSTAISDCIAAANGIVITRDIRTKISSSLSLMFREGEIGKYMHTDKQAFYGLAEYFKKGSQELKKELKDKLKLVP